MRTQTTKRYRVIISVDPKQLKKMVSMGKITTIEAIRNEFGWLIQSGITLEEIQEDM